MCQFKAQTSCNNGGTNSGPKISVADMTKTPRPEPKLADLPAESVVKSSLDMASKAVNAAPIATDTTGLVAKTGSTTAHLAEAGSKYLGPGSVLLDAGDTAAGDGDGTLQDHEGRHAAENIAAVDAFNSGPSTRSVPLGGGAGGAADRFRATVDGFTEGTKAGIMNQMQAVHSQIDNYLVVHA